MIFEVRRTTCYWGEKPCADCTRVEWSHNDIIMSAWVIEMEPAEIVKFADRYAPIILSHDTNYPHADMKIEIYDYFREGNV